MNNKLKLIFLIISVLPYYAVIITGAVVRFTAVGLFGIFIFCVQTRGKLRAVAADKICSGDTFMLRLSVISSDIVSA